VKEDRIGNEQYQNKRSTASNEKEKKTGKRNGEWDQIKIDSPRVSFHHPILKSSKQQAPRSGMQLVRSRSADAAHN